MDTSATDEAPPPYKINNEHDKFMNALDKFFSKTFSYKVVSETRTTTIDALKLLRKNYTRFVFMDVIQTYIELLRKDVHLDDGLLSQLERLINDFMNVLEPWVVAQSGDAKERQLTLPIRLAEVLKTNCENKLRIITASDNPSQNFMHQMVKKLCDYFQIRIDDSMRHGFDINDEVHLGSALYLFLLHYDQLLLPILEQIRIENQTPDSKEMIKHLNLNDDLISDYYTWKKRNTTRPMLKSVISNKLFAQAEADGNAGLSVIGNKQFKVNGGRRTRHKRSGKRSGHNKRSGKRSGHKRSDHKRSGHKRSVHKSRRR